MSRSAPFVTERSSAVVHVLVNHFKSQSRRQAVAVRSGRQGKRVVDLGDLNQGPAAEGTQAPNLSALFDNNSPLID